MKTILMASLTLFIAFLFTPSSPAQDMWLVWAEHNQDNNPIHIRHFTSGNWLTENFPGSAPFIANYMPCLSIDSDQNPWLVWAAQKEEEEAKIYCSRRENGTWRQPERVGSEEGWESNPTIAIDQEGRPWVAWSRVSGKSSEIFCARGENDRFGPATMLSQPDESPDAKPAIALAADGNPVVVWQGWSGGRMAIFQSCFRNGAWMKEELIGSSSDEDRILPGIFLNASKQLEISWQAGGTTRRFALQEGAVSALDGPSPAVPSPPLSPESLTETGAWFIRQNEAGQWENHRYLESNAPSDSSPPEAGAAGAATSHEYIGYGDSITYGSPSKNQCYIPLLDSMLEAKYPGNSYTIRNAGYPRARTYHLLSGGGYKPWITPGIDGILARYSATKILIMGGTNDVKDGDNYGDMQYNLGEMVNRARGKNYEPILATIIPRFDTSTILKRSQTLSVNYIRPLASRKSVRLADAWQTFINYGNYQKLYQSDKVHPTWTAGHQKIADAWLPAIPAPGEKPPPPTEDEGPLDDILRWANDWATGL